MTKLFLFDVRVDPVSEFASLDGFDCPVANRLRAGGEFGCGPHMVSALAQASTASRPAGASGNDFSATLVE